VFVSDEIVVPVGFATAQDRLAHIIRHDALQDASADAYDGGVVTLLRVGPFPLASRLVRAQFREPVKRDGSCMLALRWQATGPGGAVFPVLDADITLTQEPHAAVRLALVGTYRPPLGLVGAGLDRAVMHRVAAATIRKFLSSISAALADPQAVSPEAPERAGPGPQPELG